MPISPSQSARIARSFEEMNGAARWSFDDLPFALRFAIWLAFLSSLMLVALLLVLLGLNLAVMAAA